MKVRALSAAERLDWLRLARTARVGPVTFAELIKRYQEPGAALDALPKLARRAGGKIGRIPSLDSARTELDATEAAGGVMLMACEPGFPRLLRALDPPPPLITVLGDPGRLSRPACAIVGSRNASAIGRRFAQDVATGVGEAGFAIISGLARGIDAAAHMGSIESGAIAVVAGGADHIYPPEHDQLHARIVAKGAVVSERSMGVTPTARDFPRRNRLIAGLSLGVVVIEAAERSGSLITARFAAEQGRDVMAAPGSPLDPRARGSNKLIRDGATLIENADDVIAVLHGSPLTHAGEPDEPGFDDAASDEAALAAEAESVRARVLDLLSPTPTSLNEIVRYADAPAHAVLAALVELELAGRALLMPGGLVALADD